MTCSLSFCLERIRIGSLQNKTKVIQRPIKRNFNITMNQSQKKKKKEKKKKPENFLKRGKTQRPSRGWFKPLTPRSVWHLISPHSIAP